MFVAGLQCRLDFGRATNRLDGAGKLGQDRVARGVEYAAMVLFEQCIEYSAVPTQRLHCRFLVFAHHPAVAGDVGGEDRREAASQCRRRALGWVCHVGHGLAPDLLFADTSGSGWGSTRSVHKSRAFAAGFETVAKLEL